MLIAEAVFLLERGQTDRETDRRDSTPYPRQCHEVGVQRSIMEQTPYSVSCCVSSYTYQHATGQSWALDSHVQRNIVLHVPLGLQSSFYYTAASKGPRPNFTASNQCFERNRLLNKKSVQNNLLNVIVYCMPNCPLYFMFYV